jgi:hypothetical protein
MAGGILGVQGGEHVGAVGEGLGDPEGALAGRLDAVAAGIQPGQAGGGRDGQGDDGDLEQQHLIGQAPSGQPGLDRLVRPRRLHEHRP